MATGASEDLYGSGTPGDFLASVLDQHRDRIAFEYEGESVTYGQTAENIGRAIACLRHLGVGKGDTVVQLSSNRPQVFFLMAAAYIMGLRSVTLHGLGALDEHRWIASNASGKIFFFESGHAARANALKKPAARSAAVVFA